MTITLTQREIKTPKAEWFIPISAADQAWIDSDPAYAAFHHVSRHVGAWATVTADDDRFYVEIHDTVEIPVADGVVIDPTPEGDAVGICVDCGRTYHVTFPFRGSLIKVEGGVATYLIEIPDRVYQGERAN